MDLTYLPIQMDDTDVRSLQPIRRFAEGLMSRMHFVIRACLASGLAVALQAGQADPTDRRPDSRTPKQ